MPRAPRQQVGIGEGRRAQHDADGAGRQCTADGRDRAQAATKLERHVELAGDPLDMVQVDRLALAGPVEIDYMQETRSRLDERARRLERIVGVDGLLVKATLA